MALGDKVVVVVDEGKGPVKHEFEVKGAGGSADWKENESGFIYAWVETKNGATIRRAAFAKERVSSVTFEPKR